MFTSTRPSDGVTSCSKVLLRILGDVPKAESKPAIDLKALHAKIGELALGTEFLSGMVFKAGLLPCVKR